MLATPLKYDFSYIQLPRALPKFFNVLLMASVVACFLAFSIPVPLFRAFSVAP
jgi:hypothetical protein